MLAKVFSCAVVGLDDDGFERRGIGVNAGGDQRAARDARKQQATIEEDG